MTEFSYNPMGLVPLPPLPPLGKNTYEDGFGMGYMRGLQDNLSSNHVSFDKLDCFKGKVLGESLNHEEPPIRRNGTTVLKVGLFEMR